mgnify:CR=1 FL=1
MLFGGSTHTLPHLSLAPTARSFTRHCHRLAHARFLVGGKLAILILTVYGVLYTIVCVFDVSCALCARRCALCDVRCELCVVRCAVCVVVELCAVRGALCGVCWCVCCALRCISHTTHHTPHNTTAQHTTHTQRSTKHAAHDTCMRNRLCTNKIAKLTTSEGGFEIYLSCCRRIRTLELRLLV